MLDKSEITSLPQDIFIILLRYGNDAALLFLTSQYFYEWYQDINTKGQALCLLHFPHRVKINPKIVNWFIHFENIAQREYQYFSAEQIQSIERYKNAALPRNPVLLEELDLSITNLETTETPFHHLLHYANAVKDQRLFDFLYQKICLSLESDPQFKKQDIKLLVLCNQTDLIQNMIDSDPNQKATLFRCVPVSENRHPDAPEVNTLLNIACTMGYEDMVKILMPYYNRIMSNLDYADRVHLHWTGRTGTTLCLAVIYGHNHLVKHFKDSEMLGNVLQYRVSLPLYYAITTQNIEIIPELLDLGLNPGEPCWALNKASYSPLHAAAEQKDIRFMEILLPRSPFGLSQEDNDGKTPLWKAAVSGNFKMVRLLVRHDARLFQSFHSTLPDLIDENMKPCLQFILIHGHDCDKKKLREICFEHKPDWLDLPDFPEESEIQSNPEPLVDPKAGATTDDSCQTGMILFGAVSMAIGTVLALSGICFLSITTVGIGLGMFVLGLGILAVHKYCSFEPDMEIQSVSMTA